MSLASDRDQFIREVSDLKTIPDLILFMSEAKEVKSDDLIEVFNERDLKIPVILISDSNQDLVEEKSLNSEFVKQHLVKPVSLKEIRNAIQLSLV